MDGWKDRWMMDGWMDGLIHENTVFREGEEKKGKRWWDRGLYLFYFLVYSEVCVWVREQELVGSLLPSMWIPGNQLRSLGVVAKAFTLWAISPDLGMYVLNSEAENNISVCWCRPWACELFSMFVVGFTIFHDALDFFCFPFIAFIHLFRRTSHREPLTGDGSVLLSCGPENWTQVIWLRHLYPMGHFSSPFIIFILKKIRQL